MSPTVAPSTLTSPLSGSSSPTMSFRVTLFPAPEGPMMTVFCPSGISSESPLSTLRGPKDLVRRSRRIIGPGSQQHQRPEGVQHQDRLAAQDHGAGGGLPHALGPAFGGQTPQAAHQRHGEAKAAALHQAEPH